MHTGPRITAMRQVPSIQVDLPSLLAEYGRLAVQLSSADAEAVEQVRDRLRQLDELIDAYVAALPTERI